MGNGTVSTLLEHTELFRGLDSEAFAAVAGAATRLLVREGAQLLKQGDPSDHLFVVESGKVKMTVLTPQGTQLTLRFMSVGDMIGCAAVFRGKPYPASATALENTNVLSWSASQINDLLRRFPQLSANALAIVGDRAEEFLQRLREATTEKVEQRIARALQRLAVAVEQPSNSVDERNIVVSASRQELAELAGTTLYTVSRTISAWSCQGIVIGGRRRIVIKDRRRLAAIAGID
jgi:CRP-like cAMP-binding protein